MTTREILANLKSLGNKARLRHNIKMGAPENQFGVKMGDVRAIAKKIKTDHKLAIAIGEKIGLYRDWPVSKGCTPPYVPIWVEFMVKRKG
ncbi:MAG: hypothetical protein AAB074_21360 [Planctomycetota bacterium]